MNLSGNKLHYFLFIHLKVNVICIYNITLYYFKILQKLLLRYGKDCLICLMKIHYFIGQ